jgi:hypothetical protein
MTEHDAAYWAAEEGDAGWEVLAADVLPLVYETLGEVRGEDVQRDKSIYDALNNTWYEGITVADWVAATIRLV